MKRLPERYGELDPRITWHSSHKSAWIMVQYLVRAHDTPLRAFASGVIRNCTLTVVNLKCQCCSSPCLLANLGDLGSANPSVA